MGDDEFFGDNEGLLVAEVELTSEEQAFEKPLRAGDEMRGDPCYCNANLVEKPYKQW